MFSRLVICCLICACLLSPQTVRGEGTLPWPQAENVVRRYFAEAWNDRDVNLMCRGHASFVFQQLNQLGWKVADEKGILKDTPEDHEYLIQVLASSHGQRLLKHLPNEKLLYDRLDRIIKQPGGRRLVRDLLRLPGGYRYAQAKRPSGVPAMHSFLPKTSQGKVQTIRDYDKPTGRIYTLEQFIARLHQSHDQESAKSTN